MEFRARDYVAEESAARLPRATAYDHPLALRPTSSPQVDVSCCGKGDFDDPLRVDAANVGVPTHDRLQISSTSERRLSDTAACTSMKEWAVFKSFLMQKFSYSITISVSSTSDIVARKNKVENAENDRSLADVHTDELDDLILLKEDKKVLTRQEYSSRLKELKGDIEQAWRADDRLKALKLSIKVARLLLDTSVLLFYPTLFVLVTDIMDMLGDLVWERVKRKAEYADDGTLIYSLPDNFTSGDICPEAKETCYNWFCKISSIRELLPRIYLELAILRCWRFLEDYPMCNLQRLTMMMRGLADPVAFVYCHLYMVHAAGALLPSDIVYLTMTISDITNILRQIIFGKETTGIQFYKNKLVLISLMEPGIEWIMKCIIMHGNQRHDNILAEFGLRTNCSESTSKMPCTSIVLHCLLKQLPADVISNHALDLVEIVDQNRDVTLDQHLNYSLLGHKLCESQAPISSVMAILQKVLKVLTQYDDLTEYLIVADAYVDIVLRHKLDNYLAVIVEGILKRADNKRVHERELDNMQSILVKLINYLGSLEVAFASKYFMGIYNMLYGSSRNVVDVHILMKATSSGGISDPTIIQFLFEISQTLHDGIVIPNKSEDYQHRASLISRFIQLADFGTERERHLTFLVECRAAFCYIDEVKDTLVHLCNNLAIKAVKVTNKFVYFHKACMAFNEVTIPSISSSMRHLSLYLETAEVALCGGLVSHAEGFVYLAVSALQCLNATAGSLEVYDMDQVLSLARKLCSMLVMIPGNHDEGIACVPHSLISIINQSWISPRVKIKMLCSIIALAATLYQNKLPYHASNRKVVGNDALFYGEMSYNHELLSITSIALQSLDHAIEQEPHLAVRGKLALEICDCLVVSFKVSHELELQCSRLIEISKKCLHPDDKYLQSMLRLFEKNFLNV